MFAVKYTIYYKVIEIVKDGKQKQCDKGDLKYGVEIDATKK